MKIRKFLISFLIPLALTASTWAEPDLLQPSEHVKYATVKLEADLSHLDANQKKALGHMIKASQVMDRLFWMQAYGNPESLLTLTDEPEVQDYLRINYGPWDRLQANRPFLEGFGEKPLGARFYPPDMSKEEFENAEFPGKTELYTVVRRDPEGNLFSVPYNEFYRPELEVAATHLKQAAALIEEPGLKKYLELRAEALLSNEYQPSDMAWMDMKDNALDVVIGPIETYEDRLFGHRAAFEGYVLVKDQEWSQRLAHYAQFLPELQRDLPVPEEYKEESPGADSDLNAYDVVYYAGDCNAGSKTIAINLPNDEEVQLEKGSRRLQLKNAMQAKYDKILVPIAEVLIVPEQRDNITFDAFFANTMFHEVAHGLGIKKVVGAPDGLLVKTALKELSGSLEEGKADLLGIFMIEGLTRRGELPKEKLQDHYITFLAGIFRSVRFGASSAHGVANMVRFNFFQEKGAFTRGQDGLYRVDLEKMAKANQELTTITLKFQGDGDYEGVKAFVEKYGKVDQQLQADLARLKEIPTDIVFEQGAEVLGL
ncbi:MAG: Zn-dependent hydrolase [Vulcanimicrobiota bacterium]